MEGWSFTKKQPLPVITIEAAELECGKWVARLWGTAAFVYSSGKRYLGEMIYTASNSVKTVQTLTRTGWINLGSGWEFLHAGGSTGQSSLQVDLIQSTGCANLNQYKLPVHPMPLSVVSKTALSFLSIADEKISYPLFATVMLAPLGELMRQNGTPIDFTPFLAGKSQSGKSSLASACLAFFGDFDKTKFPANFTDTANSLEAKLVALQDVLSVVDDYFPTSQDQQGEMKAVLRKLVRATSDGNLRSRYGKPTGVSRAFMLCTGETRPDLAPSDLNRLVFIDIDRTDIDYAGAFRNLFVKREDLRHFMTHYLQWISQNWQRIARRIPRVQRHLERIHASYEQGRTLSSLHKLAVGIDIALIFLLASGCINQATARIHRKVAGKALRSLYDLEACQTPAMSPGEMYLTALSELIQAKKAEIIPLTQSQAPSAWIGCFDSDTAFLLPSASYEAVKKHYSRQGASFTASAAELWKDLMKMQVIAYSQTRKRYTHQKKLLCRASAPTDLLFIPRSKIAGL